MFQRLQKAALSAIAVLATGCQLTTPEGAALSLRPYDSVVVEDVHLAPGVSEPQLAPLLKGHAQVAVLESARWKLAGDFDLDAFADLVETYATTAGTVDGKPVDPVMTREEFLEKHAEANRKRRAMLAEPSGSRPVSLRISVTDLRFPETLERIAAGTKPRLRCRIEVFADGRLLGGGTREAIEGIPGIPLLPASMVGRAAKAMLFDELRRKTILKLVDEMAAESVHALEQAK